MRAGQTPGKTPSPRPHAFSRRRRRGANPTRSGLRPVGRPSTRRSTAGRRSCLSRAAPAPPLPRRDTRRKPTDGAQRCKGSTGAERPCGWEYGPTLSPNPPGALANGTAQLEEILLVAPPLLVLIRVTVERATSAEPGTRARCGAVSPCADRLWGTGARRGPYTWHPSLTVDCKLTPDVLLLPRPASRPRTCGPPGWISVRRRMPTAPSSDRSHRSWVYPRH